MYMIAGDSLSSAQLADITESINSSKMAKDSLNKQTSAAPISSRPLYSNQQQQQQLMGANSTCPPEIPLKPLALVPAATVSSTSTSSMQAGGSAGTNLCISSSSSVSTDVRIVPTSVSERTASPALEKNKLFPLSKASASNFLKTFKEKISKPLSAGASASAQKASAFAQQHTSSSSSTVRQRALQNPSPVAATLMNVASALDEQSISQSEVPAGTLSGPNHVISKSTHKEATGSSTSAIETVSARVQVQQSLTRTPTATATDSDNTATAPSGITSSSGLSMQSKCILCAILKIFLLLFLLLLLVLY